MDPIPAPAHTTPAAPVPPTRTTRSTPGGPLSALRGSSPPIQRLREELARAAASDATVLLLGETGTGKGLAARAVHAVSPRRARRFVHVDCASLSPQLVESELFGHERGAFTGAVERRVGRFERAAESTLFLDEIGELEPALQVKLLRVLEEREYERVGGTRTLAMSARVVAATHRDLEEAVRVGRFRADLYFRLCVLPIQVPALRERLQDLPVLVEHILEELAERRGRALAAPPEPGSLAPLLAYAWPGNVRQLVHVLERLVVLSPEAPLSAGLVARVIGEAPDFLSRSPVGARSSTVGPEAACGVAPSGVALAQGAAREEEARRIAGALLASGGNLARAARRLEMPRSTLRYRVELHGLEGLIPRD